MTPSVQIAYCLTVYKYCWNANPPGYIIELYYGPVISGNFYDCDNTEFQVPDPVEENEPTECFHLEVGCEYPE